MYLHQKCQSDKNGKMEKSINFREKNKSEHVCVFFFWFCCFGNLIYFLHLFTGSNRARNCIEISGLWLTYEHENDRISNGMCKSDAQHHRIMFEDLNQILVASLWQFNT